MISPEAIAWLIAAALDAIATTFPAARDVVVLADGTRRSCASLVYERAAPNTSYEDFVVLCDGVRYRLGDVRGVVTQR